MGQHATPEPQSLPFNYLLSYKSLERSLGRGKDTVYFNTALHGINLSLAQGVTKKIARSSIYLIGPRIACTAAERHMAMPPWPVLASLSLP